ncbi:general substrate transporter [Zychaea mexicana]|uniref:general substrate transporter n=1 Tax=Zychaea mexicana TaxID=64656 RepID=UPI0022FED67E|nr:general substrate transporter [Zychaea mexicana]KAI9491539.1 general substrate transporter [Zychaea mexicana]
MSAILREEHHSYCGSLSSSTFTLTHYASCVILAIGGLLFGYDQGVMSGILVMEHWIEYFNNPNAVWRGFITSIYLLGAFVGGLAAGPISERIGRKRSIMAGTFMFWFGTSMQTGATNVELLMAGRFFQGISIGMYSMNITVYQSELSPAHLRGRAITFQQFSIVTGIMVAFWIGYGCAYIPSDASWRVPLGIQLAPSVVLFFGCFILPYSPRWLASKGRYDEALETLAKLHADGDANNPYVRQEFDEIMEQVRFEEKHAMRSYREVFRSKSTRKRVFLAMGIQGMQQWIGINAVLYYAPFIFQSAGMTGTLPSLLATGVNGIVCVIFTVPALLYIDKLGRRKTILGGSIGMGTSMLIAGSLLRAHPYVEGGDNNTQAQYGAVAMMFIFSASFSTSWGPCGWIYPAEIFPNRARAKGTSLATATNYLMNFVIGEITPIMLDRISYGTYFFFFATNVICAFIIWKFYPETKGRSLEEMEILFGGEEAEVIKAVAERRYDASGAIVAEPAQAAESSSSPDEQKEKTQV